MPYPNEHACQLRNPDTLRMVGSRDRDHAGKPYRILFGIPRATAEAESVEQAYRYPAGTWTAGEARAHCAAHDGIDFEPATTGKADMAAARLRAAAKGGT